MNYGCGGFDCWGALLLLSLAAMYLGTRRPRGR